MIIQKLYQPLGTSFVIDSKRYQPVALIVYDLNNSVDVADLYETIYLDFRSIQYTVLSGKTGKLKSIICEDASNSLINCNDKFALVFFAGISDISILDDLGYLEIESFNMNQ